MPGLTELLDDAVGPRRPRLRPRRRLVARARRRHRAVRVRRAIAGVVVLALVTGAALLVTRGDGTTRITTPVTPPSRGVFPDTTRTVLALSDGYDGATFVDLDHRIAVRRPIDGERAGDQPYRLTRVGNSLVVGWGDVYAAPLDGGPSKLLGHATYYVPAADAGAVWLIDYSGGAIGQGTSTFREVDRAGRVLVETPGPDASLGYPAIGIPGGIAFETEQGVALWNAASGQVTATLGSVPRLPTFVSDSHGDLLAWCETTCDLFHVTRLAPSGPVDLPILPPHQTTFDARAAAVLSRWRSPRDDGRRLDHLGRHRDRRAAQLVPHPGGRPVRPTALPRVVVRREATLLHRVLVHGEHDDGRRVRARDG